MDLKTTLKEFGLRLKKARKEKGLSQVRAAEEMKIDYRHYQNIEGGKINLRMDTFCKLIQFYSISAQSNEGVDQVISLLSNGEQVQTHGKHSKPNLHAEAYELPKLPFGALNSFGEHNRSA